ncbi:hypothetical protein LC605_18680 [Nostoc sp. CHAB 5836]|uniref:hypothetical protein n=1 Tax=Nostoc sp. CHAB 5836 TaxID=2780404 RepID=UPI001E47F219|nr:hypothetical protein [Nostoc sp. CHAB 5836]MCC5617067.1 hypothetical protein [Nostoc sp. CHAB 5836]
MFEDLGDRYHRDLMLLVSVLLASRRERHYELRTGSSAKSRYYELFGQYPNPRKT